MDFSDNTNTTAVRTGGNHNGHLLVHLEERDDFSSLKVELDGIILTDRRINEADSTAIMGNKGWDSFITNEVFVDTAKLEFSFLVFDPVNCETTTAIIEKTELFIGFAKFDNIHKTGWVTWVGTDLSIDLNKSVLDNSLNFVSIEGILQSVTEEDDEWKAFTKFMGTSGWVGGKFTLGLGKHPMGWGG